MADDGLHHEADRSIFGPGPLVFEIMSSTSVIKPLSPIGLRPSIPTSTQHTDDAASKETRYLRRRCFNCCTTEPLAWRRSTLNPGKVVCNKCGLYERTHLRPRPLRFDELCAGDKTREQRSADKVLNPRPSSTNIIPLEDDDSPAEANSQIPDNPPNVHLFSSANNTTIEDSTFNIAGRDMNIIHNHHTSRIESQWDAVLSWLKFESLSKLFATIKSHIFHAAEILKNVLERGFETVPEIKLEAMIAEDALKYPPLNARVLLSKTSLCLPGFLSQTLTSLRYSFF